MLLMTAKLFYLSVQIVVPHHAVNEIIHSLDWISLLNSVPTCPPCLVRASYARLSYPRISYARLSYARLAYARLAYARLAYARLAYARLAYARLAYARLAYARLSYARLSYARLSYARLSYARLSYAPLTCFPCAIYPQCLLCFPTLHASVSYIFPCSTYLSDLVPPVSYLSQCYICSSAIPVP